VSKIKETGEGHVVVNIKEDTSAGINSEALPRLFEKFASKSYRGRGLGYFVSKSIIEAHDGRIWAGNNTDCKGVTFSFGLLITNSAQRSMLP
jgi:K+-sensing histidine kinase KdpD